MPSKNSVIRDTLNDLKANSFVDGFEDCVLGRVRDALNEFEQGAGLRFWNRSCCGAKGPELIADFFDGDNALFEEYKAYSEYANVNGFQMPHWGTRGT